MADITVPVPDDRVPEFFSFFGLWLAGSLSLPAAASGIAQEPPETPQQIRDWGNTDEDLADAVTLWTKFSPRARAMFSLLIDNPGQEYTGEQIAEACNIPNGAHGVAGVLAWPGRHGAAIGRGLPSEWVVEPETYETFYSMPAERAALFGAAREQAEAAN